MTKPEAIQFLINSYALQLWEKDMAMGDPNALREIGTAVQAIEPYHIDWACNSCLQGLMNKASRIKQEQLKFYTFPK